MGHDRRLYIIRQVTYIETRYCNHCCSGKAITFTYYECMFLTLGIKHALHVRYIVICGLPGCTRFFRIISLKARFRKSVL